MSFINTKSYIESHDRNKELETLDINLFHHPIVLSIRPVLTLNLILAIRAKLQSKGF